MSNKVVIKTPHAAVIIWNYRDRLGSEKIGNGITDVDDVESTIISTVSLISISTSKTKANPVGHFEIILAPTKNWVSSITAGSWMCIMMSNNKILEADFQKAQKDKVKFFGRIESVRQNVTVNQETGARQSTYSVTGVDWATVFDNKLYIDPYIDPKQNLLAGATVLNILELVAANPKLFFSTRQNLINIISIMGMPFENLKDLGDSINRIAKTSYDFELPLKVAQFMQFGMDTNSNVPYSSNSKKLTELLNLYTGPLIRNDTYSNFSESNGIFNFQAFTGINTMWQILIEHSNPTLNETLADIRWGSEGRPRLAIYSRIRPFVFKGKQVTNKIFNKQIDEQQYITGREQIEKQAEEIISEFQKVRTIQIPLEYVISIDYGTNWRDKYNFIEVKPSFQGLADLSIIFKAAGQYADQDAFKREGFRPLIEETKQWPINEKDPLRPIDPYSIVSWKFLMKEWYFDTHRLLNGTITFAGISDYIQVGDNIIVDGKILNTTPNTKLQNAKSGKYGFLLAHVESISHNFTVSQDGPRSYITSIQFVRGILVDDVKNKMPMGTDSLSDGMLDRDSSKISIKEKDNSRNVIKIPSSTNPTRKGQ